MNIENQEQTFYNKIIGLTDWEPCLVKKNNFNDRITPLQKYLAEEIFVENKISSDEIYFSGEVPLIQIKLLKYFDATTIAPLQKKIWNEGRSPFLVVITPVEMRLFNCYDSPVENPEDLGRKLQLDKFEDIENDLNRVVELLHQSKIDSGKIWEEKYGNNVTIHHRVDKRLVSNLKSTRLKLYNNGKGLPLSIIHDLLGRALFIFYLEDRKILTKDAYPRKSIDVENFSDLLDFRDDAYALFDKLKRKFNGDLFPISADERRLVNSQHLQLVKSCFFDSDSANRQFSLWRMFQFEYIPIELISAIYEEFMNAEEDEKDGVKTIRANGAYYTKPMLVELMLNEVLPWPDKDNIRYNHKILDPACGSGIFLVESYRRLIARWKFSNNTKKIDEHSLREILLNSIYGIDKDTGAIKVAAFSLYLTFLNYLEPIEIRNDYLEKDSKKLEPLIRWSDTKELDDRKDNRPGNNLFQFDTFAQNDIKNLKFDIIIGNPPWKKDKPEPEVNSYIVENNLPRQIVCAYVDYMPQLLDSEGVIALVVAAKIFFNTGKGYEDFRQKIFGTYDISTIVNLSVVRDIMFDNASAPGAVIVYRNIIPTDKQEMIVYCTPKNVKIINNTQSLIIDATEVKYLPLREVLNRDSKILKIAMWGGMRDYQFINKLKCIRSIDDVTADVEKGTGLHKKEKDGPFGNEILRNNLFIKPDNIKQYYTTVRDLKPLNELHLKYRTNNKNVFNAPIILINEGSKNADFCASFIDYDCVYLSSAYGISIKNLNNTYHKALVACLNSTLASYFYFLTSSSWGVDKGGRVQNNDAISFPYILDQMSESTIIKLANKLDEIRSIRINISSEEKRKKRDVKIKKITTSELFSNIEIDTNSIFENIHYIQGEIDNIIFNELKFTENEKHLISDVLNNSIALKQNYDFSKAMNPIEGDDLMSYANNFANTLNQTLKYGKNRAWLEVLNPVKTELLNIIIIHFGNSKSTNNPIVTDINSERFNSLIKQIDSYSLQQHSESIYYRKVIKYYKNDKIYLIKPNEKRFWTVSQALNDADSVLIDLLAVKEN